MRRAYVLLAFVGYSAPCGPLSEEKPHPVALRRDQRARAAEHARKGRTR